MLERIFETIRKEDAVLWVGAGFSKYAGYPTGSELAKILYENLTQEERKDISLNLSFDKLAQVYIDLRGTQNSLIELLRKTYAYHVPISTEYHDKLAKIPHIKTVITTNYDTLLENAYGNEAIKVVTDTDVTHIKENKTTIIKIHGDFSQENKLIITSEDYASFINEGLSSPIWNVVIERLATKHLIFLGYSMEDPNVMSLLKRLTDTLGDSRKEIYFISPEISQSKMGSLHAKKIIPVKLSGEEFVDGLIKNVEDNILTDLKKGNVSIGTCQEFMKRRKLHGKFISGSNSIEITDFYSPDRSIEHKGVFKINDMELAQLIKDNRSTESILIPQDVLLDVEFRIDGLKHPISDISNLKSITIEPIPEKTFTDFIFEDKNLNVKNVKTKLYKANKAVRMVFTFDAGELTLKIEVNKDHQMHEDISVLMQYKHFPDYRRPVDEILFYSFLLSILSGNQFKLLTQTGFQFEFGVPTKDKDILDQIEMGLSYFRNLSIIEEYYEIFFNEIANFTPHDIHKVTLIAKGINGSILDNTEDMLIRLSFDKESNLKAMLNIDNDKFTAIVNEDESVIIHNYEFILGRKIIEIVDPVYKDLDKFNQEDETTSLTIECKAGKYFVQYENLLNGNKQFLKVDV